ncbi:unnamed protein product [Camellia sinensis]
MEFRIFSCVWVVGCKFTLSRVITSESSRVLLSHLLSHSGTEVDDRWSFMVSYRSRRLMGLSCIRRSFVKTWEIGKARRVVVSPCMSCILDSL